DLATGLAVGDPEHGGEALVDAPVVGLVAAALEFLALLRVQMNRLHDVPTWADNSPRRRAFAAAFRWPLEAAVGLRGHNLLQVAPPAVELALCRFGAVFAEPRIRCRARRTVMPGTAPVRPG